MTTVSVVAAVPLFGSFSGFFDFLLLFFDEKSFHWVVVIMVLYQFGQLDFFG